MTELVGCTCTDNADPECPLHGVDAILSSDRDIDDSRRAEGKLDLSAAAMRVPPPCSHEASVRGCACVPMQGGLVVVSPYCRMHGHETDGHHGFLLNLSKVIPSPQTVTACVHVPFEPHELAPKVGMPLGEYGLLGEPVHEVSTPVIAVRVCRKCRLVYAP